MWCLLDHFLGIMIAINVRELGLSERRWGQFDCNHKQMIGVMEQRGEKGVMIAINVSEGGLIAIRCAQFDCSHICLIGELYDRTVSNQML